MQLLWSLAALTLAVACMLISLALRKQLGALRHPRIYNCVHLEQIPCATEKIVVDLVCWKPYGSCVEGCRHASQSDTILAVILCQSKNRNPPA